MILLALLFIFFSGLIIRLYLFEIFRIPESTKHIITSAVFTLVNTVFIGKSFPLLGPFPDNAVMFFSDSIFLRLFVFCFDLVGDGLPFFVDYVGQFFFCYSKNICLCFQIAPDIIADPVTEFYDIIIANCTDRNLFLTDLPVFPETLANTDPICFSDGTFKTIITFPISVITVFHAPSCKTAFICFQRFCITLGWFLCFYFLDHCKHISPPNFITA